MDSFLVKLKSLLFDSWKTTATALALGLIAILKTYGVELSDDATNYLVGILVGLGFLFAKDGDVSGGTKK